MKAKYVVAALILLNCGYDFPTSYENVESYKVRPIAIIFDNKGMAEAAPRDSITLTGYFGGEQIKEINWYSLSFNTQTNTFDTSKRTPLPLIGSPQILTNNNNTDSVQLSIIVPESLIIYTFRDVQSFRSLIPSEMQSSFSAELLDRKPVEVIEILEQLAYGSTADKLYTNGLLKLFTDNSASSIEKNLPVILQAFTVPFKIGALVNGKFRVESTLSVRYNSRLQHLGTYIPVNKNPVIEQIMLYKIKGIKNSFDPVADHQLIDTAYTFSGYQTISFDKNCSYFLSASTNYYTADTGMTLSGTRGKEDYTFEWFYKNNDKTEVSSESFFYTDIFERRSATVHIKPPLSSEMQHFSVWLVVYDFYIGERFRPVGFGLKHIEVQISSFNNNSE
ncbi:MAG: hypothetical protein Q8935_00125 [Bacillota bacterium]|nr:hypothetical protein [Bacillota bacterium]